MGRIEETRHLSAAPEALWKVISDLKNWSDWFTIHERWMEEPPADLAVGNKLVAKVVMLGMANKLEWVVAAIDAPTKLTLTGTGMAGVQVEFAFTVTPAADGGSELSIVGEFEGAMIKGALGKAVEKDGLVQVEASLAKLDELASAGV